MIWEHLYILIMDFNTKVAVAEFVNDIPAIIKHKNLLGFQFHPEKSQDAGRYILQNSIEELMNAK